MNGMSHATEFVGLIDRHKWRVTEQPVTILYTEYSRAKGQSLFNGVNILADGLLHAAEVTQMPVIQIVLIAAAAGLVVLRHQPRKLESVGRVQAAVRRVRDARGTP